MKFTVSSAELLKGLMDVSKAIPAKSVQPILENFLLVLKDNILEITASDSDLTLRTSAGTAVSPPSRSSLRTTIRRSRPLERTRARWSSPPRPCWTA